MSVPEGKTPGESAGGNKKIIGVLGGMGPEATADMFIKIIRATPAATDQEHVRVIIDSNADIPDRTAFIEGRGGNPIPLLVETAQNLVRAGAELIVIPCNTAHFFHEQVQEAVAVPVLHMMKEAARAARGLVGGVRSDGSRSVKVGILATSGTIKTGLYHRALESEGLEAIIPDSEEQRLIMAAIYVDGLKAQKHDRPRQILTQAAEGLIARGADLIITGCTEFPLVLKPGMVSRPIIDPTQTVAEAAVRMALGAEN